jgi:hypothetical protein
MLFPADEVLAMSAAGWEEVLDTIAPFFSTREMTRIEQVRHDALVAVGASDDTWRGGSTERRISSHDGGVPGRDDDNDDDVGRGGDIDVTGGMAGRSRAHRAPTGAPEGGLSRALRRSERNEFRKTSYRHSNKLNRRRGPPDAGELAGMRATFEALGEPGTAHARESIRLLEAWLAKAPPGERTGTQPTARASQSEAAGVTDEDVKQAVKTRIETLFSAASKYSDDLVVWVVVVVVVVLVMMVVVVTA